MGEEAVQTHSSTLLGDYEPVSAEAVYQAAREGDPAASEIIERVSGYLALALQQIIVAYDVESIVLGGGVSHDGQAFLEPVQRHLGRLREGSALTNEMLRTDMIRLLPPDYHAGTWGAVVLAGGSLAFSKQTPDEREKGGESLKMSRVQA